MATGQNISNIAKHYVIFIVISRSYINSGKFNFTKLIYRIIGKK